MSFSSIFTKITGIGSIGRGIFSVIEKFATNTIDRYAHDKHSITERYNKFGTQLDSLHISVDSNARTIPIVFGKSIVNGTLIWAADIHESSISNSSTKYIKSQHLTKLFNQTDYFYYCTFAIGICEGTIDSIENIWINGICVDLHDYNHSLYLGDEEQKPSPIIEKHLGKLKTPGLRGLAYIVFENFPLSEFRNRIPNFDFEVVRKSSKINDISQSIQSIVMIPGSGEFVYDTDIVYKEIFTTTEKNKLVSRTAINCNTKSELADSVFSLNQLQSECIDLKWIEVVATWFADNLDAGKCNIYPAVEYNDETSFSSKEWRVANYDRTSARLISRDANGHPNYGGTVNDASIFNYLLELKRRNIKIAFNPMFFLDLIGKPWRGHVFADDVTNIKDFFYSQHGYRNFILHYANLVKDHVDAFIIGSELIGLTKFCTENTYPAVLELITLANDVRATMGKDVILTYAADWSEYHHTEGGWYNLDPLWACDNINVVGIDNYFPITSSHDSVISDDEIYNGFNSGEGYDYYISTTGEKCQLSATYAWKNIAWWWGNHHVNPDNKQTAWLPRSKPIWFTEFGFPSIDKSTNQPNVFFDPLCKDGGAPKYSNAATDFDIQKRAIKLFYKYWSTQEYINNMFLWTWDARPYPTWPHSNVWSDGALWEKGHWVNGKLQNENLSAILEEVCNRVGIQSCNFTNINSNITGLVIDTQTSALDLINRLRCCYFFDIRVSFCNVAFIGRANKTSHAIDSNDLINLDDSNFYNIKNIHDNVKLSDITIEYIDVSKSYNRNSIHSAIENDTALSLYLKVPICWSDQGELKQILHTIINNIQAEKSHIHLKLPLTYKNLMPCDVIHLDLDSIQDNYYRITATSLKDNTLELYATQDCNSIYNAHKYSHDVLSDCTTNNNDVENFIHTLPLSVNRLLDDKSDVEQEIYAISRYSIYIFDRRISQKVKVADGSRDVYSIIEAKMAACADIYQYSIDRTSHIIISSSNYIDTSLKPLGDIEALAIITSEILQFEKIEKIAPNTYKISHFIRNAITYNLEQEDNKIKPELFIPLKSYKKLTIDNAYLSNKITFYSYNAQTTSTFLRHI